MDAAQALADLTEISSQIEAAVLFDAGGAALGSTLGSDEASGALVRRALELVESAAGFRADGGTVVQLEASTREGSVFVVREGERGIVAATGPQPTVGLVFYDLKSCLRSAAGEADKPKRRRKAAAKEEQGGETDDAA